MQLEERCKYFEKGEQNIDYCNRDHYECEHQSKWKFPYAINGQVGGRKYKCDKEVDENWHKP